MRIIRPLCFARPSTFRPPTPTVAVPLSAAELAAAEEGCVIVGAIQRVDAKTNQVPSARCVMISRLCFCYCFFKRFFDVVFDDC